MRFILDTSTAALILALLGNLLAMTWGAAKFSGAVDRLTKWAERADTKIDDHESRISQIEGAIR